MANPDLRRQRLVRFRRGALHPEVLPAVVRREFADVEPGACWPISSPRDVAAWTSLRAKWRIGEQNFDGPKMPCDVFIWWPGEPSDRRMTRLGGVPYLPKDAAWPEHEGEPMTFVAQFAFHDSHDLVGALPGDVLLVFAAAEWSLMDGTGLHLQWVRDGIEPIAASRCPRTSWRILRAAGVRCRMWDLPGGYAHAYEVHRSLKASDPLAAGRSDLWRSPVIQATKIGGAPFDAQTNRPEVPKRHRFLCQLSAAYLAPGCWGRGSGAPALRRPRSHEGALRSFSLADVGASAFFVSASGKVRVHGSSG